ncbi:MAG: hypothetical protein Q8Q09_20405 [Deltaproteobacteria bacterium]|nr:hypothetical protein [Deltaproteobacteria bacterium]
MSKDTEQTASATSDKTPAAAGDKNVLEVAHAMRYAGYGGLAVGAIELGIAAVALSRGLSGVVVSMIAPGALALLMAVLLMQTATSLESKAQASDAGALVLPAVTQLFQSLARYLTLTLALCAVAFLVVAFDR